MKLYYKKGKYVADGSLAIQTYEKDEVWGCYAPYGTATVCLKDYGMTPKEGTIFMPIYKMTKEFVEQVFNDIVEYVISEVPIGLGTGLYVRLKPNWEGLVDMIGEDDDGKV